MRTCNAIRKSRTQTILLILIGQLGCSHQSSRAEQTPDRELVATAYAKPYRWEFPDWDQLPPLTEDLKEIASRGDCIIEHLQERFESSDDKFRTIRVMAELGTPAACRFLFARLRPDEFRFRLISYALCCLTGDRTFWDIAKLDVRSEEVVRELREKWERGFESGFVDGKAIPPRLRPRP